MTATDIFAFGFEFQGNPPYYAHSNNGKAGNFYTNNPYATGTHAGKGQGFRCHYDDTLAANMPTRPFCCYRNAVYNSNIGFTLYRSSGTIADALAWMGGNVSVSIEVLCRWESADSCGDVPWCQCSGTSHFRVYTNRYQSYKSQFHVIDDATGTSRGIQEATSSPAASWVHYVCQVQAGDAITPGVFKIYRNGVQTASADWSYGNLRAPTSTLGNWFYSSNCYQGWGIDGAKLAFVRYYAGLADPTELYNRGTWREPLYVNPNYRESQIRIDCNGTSGAGTSFIIQG